MPVLTTDFRYTEISGREFEECVLSAIKVLEATLPVSGPDRIDRWEATWQENLEEYLATGSLESLLPKYLFRHTVMRYMQGYIRPVSRNFEADFYMMACYILFRKYLQEATSVIDFGCGSGAALFILSNMFPDKPLVGCDWAPSSQMTLEAIVKRTGKRITPIKFDMFSPDTSVPFTEGCGVITILAMEQLGTNYGSFLEFLLANRPRICLHLEPILELYDENNLLDWLATRYHRKRGYLEGFLTSLRELESAGDISIVDVRRLFFGSQFHEAYSVVVWRPR